MRNDPLQRDRPRREFQFLTVRGSDPNVRALGDMRWSIFADCEDYISTCVLTNLSMQPQAHGRSRLQRAFRKMLKFCRRRTCRGPSLRERRRHFSILISVLSADLSGLPRLYQFSGLDPIISTSIILILYSFDPDYIIFRLYQESWTAITWYNRGSTVHYITLQA